MYSTIRFVSNRQFLLLAGVAVLFFLGAVPTARLLFGGEEEGKGEEPGRPARRGAIVFVVDASASMRIPDVQAAGGTVTRLRETVREIEATLAGLSEGGEFYFDVVVCSSRIEVLSASLGIPGPIRLDEKAEGQARAFLAERTATGMTPLFDAIQRAFRICDRAPLPLLPGSILLYTDGMPTFGKRTGGPRNVEDFFPAVRDVNPGGVRVNAYSVSATSEGTAFLRRLCSENGGILFTP